MIPRNPKPSSALGSFSFGGRKLLAAITLLGFALRSIRLDFQPLWWDEGYSIFFATRPFAELLQRTALDIHPPFYYIVLQFWIGLFGATDTAVRLLSVFIGTLSIPLLYLLARTIFRDPRPAWIATLLLALSPLHIYYSQEVRMYGLVTALALASTYFFVCLLEKAEWSKRDLPIAALYALSMTAALYTQYFAAFLIVFQFVYVALFARKAFARWLALWLTIFSLYLPWIIYAGGQLYAYVSSKVAIESYAPLDPLTFLLQHLAAFSVGHLTDWQFLGAASVLPIGLAIIGARNYSLTHPHTPIPTYSLFIPLALGYLVNLLFSFHPIRYERLLLFAAPAFYLLAAAGIAAIKRYALALSALFVICASSALSLFNFYSAPRYPQDDYRPLIAQMQSLAQADDNFLAIYPWQIGYLAAYYRGARLNIIETPNDAWINNAGKMQSGVNALLQKNPRVWLPALQTQGRLLEDALDAYFRPQNYSVSDAWFGTTRLELFARSSDPARATKPLAFQEDISIGNWGVSLEPIIAGQEFARVWFDWGSNPPTDVNFSLRLTDRNGNIWAQEDRDFASGMQRVGLAVPAGTPPGEYSLRLALYHARIGQPIRPADDATRADSLLASIKIAAPAQPLTQNIQQRVAADYANGMRLLGYDAPIEPLRPGFSGGVTLYWQTTRALAENYHAILVLKDSLGRTVAESRANLARGVYPPTDWHAGEMVRDPQALLVFGDAGDGAYQLQIALENRNGTRERTTDGRDAIALGTVEVKSRAHYFGAPAATNRAEDRLENVARLIGYDVIRNPNSARVVLYWQALSAPRVSYSGFAHLVDANDHLIAQRDQIPGNGALPTTSWVSGEYLIDAYDIALPESAPRGIYKIRVGMYDPITGARLVVSNAANQVIGDYIELSTRIDIQ
ncbi:MAG: glycosyltransferase family 39 protein [Chloroflexi bacterium]|nr:glycosyltransferase family 39 protein [Chloroflexota bacterium]